MKSYRGVTATEITASLTSLLPRHLTADDVIFVCIGTDRSTGDALGPIVGTRLKERGYNVVGTLDCPVHAMNLAECIAQLNAEHADKTVIAIDACLGQLTSVGVVMCGNGPIMPGAGVGKELPPVGEYFISGIVNVGGFMEYFVLQNTRLSLVVRMADDIAAAIVNVLPITEASAIA